MSFDSDQLRDLVCNDRDSPRRRRRIGDSRAYNASAEGTPDVTNDRANRDDTQKIELSVKLLHVSRGIEVSTISIFDQDIRGSSLDRVVRWRLRLLAHAAC